MLRDFDKQLLNLIQGNLPLAKRPFAVLAERLDSDEDTVINRLGYLKDQGYIRRIGPFFDSARLGYVSTLVALRVEPGSLRAVAEAVNGYPGVTHNYEREGKYNLWFALLSPDRQTQEQVLAEVAELPGVERLLNLPAVKKFKVNVQFTLE
jgi:siroheme decarboxylase